jgi:hypothetical protein
MGIRYVGLPPNTDSSVVTKGWADNYQASVVVNTAWVNSTLTAEATHDQLMPPSYVDSEDALRAHKTAVDTADQAYIPDDAWGAPNGVAMLDTNGDVLMSELPPGIPTSRQALVYTAARNGNVYLQPGTYHQTNTQTYREFCLADISIPDPGYPWRPLVYAQVGGFSAGGTPPATARQGTGNMGLVTVMPPAEIANTIYGVGLCTALYEVLGFYPVLPAGIGGQTPLSTPPLIGGIELELWCCSYAMAGYVFVGDGMFFRAQVIPGM